MNTVIYVLGVLLLSFLVWAAGVFLICWFCYLYESTLERRKRRKK